MRYEVCGFSFSSYRTPQTADPHELKFQANSYKKVHWCLWEVTIHHTFLSFIHITVYPGVCLVFDTKYVVQLEVQVNLFYQICPDGIHYSKVVDEIRIQFSVFR